MTATTPADLSKTALGVSVTINQYKTGTRERSILRMEMTILLLILTSCLSGCLTVRPRISRSHMEACKQLCFGNKGVLSMSSNLDLTFTGIVLKSQECACKNFKTFQIFASDQSK